MLQLASDSVFAAREHDRLDWMWVETQTFVVDSARFSLTTRLSRRFCDSCTGFPLARREHYIQQFQALTQNVFVLMLLPGRNNTC